MATRPQIKGLRLAYVVSHPIQYQADLLRQISADPEIDLTVLFCSDFSTRAYRDTGFGVQVEWDVPLTAGYRHIFLPRWRDIAGVQPLAPISRGFFRALRRGVDGQPFDAMWIHGYSTVNALHAIVAARALGIPVLLRAEPWLSDHPRSSLTLGAKRIFFHLLRQMVAAVLPIGSLNAEYWRFYFGDRFPAYRMPYAVDNDFFARESLAAGRGREDLRRQLGLDSGRPVILFASKLQQRKHCDHLLEAFLNLVSSGASTPEPYLVIVGDGEQMPELQQRVQQAGNTSVRFAGFRNQRELPRFFDLADLFVLPSRHEPWGLIVNEAMACGLPVIVSDDVGCHPDLVRHGENGFVYNFGDVAQLTSAIQQVLRPGEAECMGLRSREIVDGWSYRQDIDGLKRALTAVTRIPLGTSPPAAEV